MNLSLPQSVSTLAATEAMRAVQSPPLPPGLNPSTTLEMERRKNQQATEMLQGLTPSNWNPNLAWLSLAFGFGAVMLFLCLNKK